MALFAHALLTLAAAQEPAATHAASAEPAPHAREALVIVLDEVGSSALALWGGPLAIRTPTLEALAERGVRFTRAYSNPRCDPARRSLQTGHWWVGSNGPACREQGDEHTPKLSEDFVAERLARHTVALFGKSHLGVSPTGAKWEGALLEHGFDAFVCGVPSNVRRCGDPQTFLGYGDDPSRPGGQPRSTWLRVDADATRAESTWRTGYQPDELVAAFEAAWPAMARPRVAFFCPQLAHEPTHVPEGVAPAPPQAKRFEAMVAYLDAQLARVLAAVDLERTLVVIVGDNGVPGESAADPARAKGTTYEGGVRVPLLVVGGPVTGAGRTADELVHVVDLYQTLIDWCGDAEPPGSEWPIASRSLLPLLAGERSAPHEFVICGQEWGVTDQGDSCVVTADGWKLRQLDTTGDGVADAEDLFRLPDESLDLLEKEPERAAELRAILERERLP